MNSCLLRYPARMAQVASVVHFAAKRSVKVRNMQRRIEIDLMWNGVLKRVTRWMGYSPARQLRIGSDHETRKTRRQIQAWVQTDRWVDDDDGFDDYNHVSIVTHPDAASDQFKLAEAWMQGHHDAVSEQG